MNTSILAAHVAPARPQYTIEPMSPFGAIISDPGGEGDMNQLDHAWIHQLLRDHKVLVWRGFKTLPKQDFALFGQRLGEPLQWPFGAINDLKVKPDTENYIFTDHAVPMHWDGAFAGKIPHIILFQCIIAPNKADMGGTTFTDTTSILKQASPEQLARWQDITITYATKKIVHYGGKITQRLIDHHPVDGIPVLRYAEPVEDLNPVTLEVRGLQGLSQQDFIAEMHALLYQPDHLYTHRWEAGDIVMADNHALLHGREAFRNPNERYIQRINVLHRPRQTAKRWWKNSLTIRRKEFFVAELPIFLIPLLLSVQAWTDFLNPALWMGLAALFLFFNIGDMVNCLSDYELDAIYKSHLSNAVYELGKRNVKHQIAVSSILGIILTAAVGIIADRLYLIPVTLLGLLIGLQYSARPLKFKSRGIWQLLCLWGIIFFGPMAYTAIAAQGLPSLFTLGIFAAFGFHQMGIIMLNTAEDFTEDKAAGLRTVIIALGLAPAMRFAFLLVILSGLALQTLFAVPLLQSQAPWYLYPAILIFTAGWLKIIWEYNTILQKIKGKTDAEATQVLKKNGMKVPEWLKIGAYTALAVISIIFLNVLMS
jgi:alpha-ketoglutarate-dependent taurine dioxygenase/4-hydroxybenzoate polyprenyltransferase